MALLSAARQYTGRIINLDLDDVRYPDGSVGKLEMIRHPGAAAVVPFVDPPEAPNPRVRLIRQFRHAADGHIWEVPAGRLDPGETPEHCARRELEEEAGVTAGSLRHLTSVYTTPGFTDERIHLFAATNLSPVPARREPDEFVEVHDVPWDHLMELIRKGDVVDGKTIMAILFVHSYML